MEKVLDIAPDSIPVVKWDDVIIASSPLVNYGSGSSPVAGALQSPNFKSGTAGWQLDSNGAFEGNSGIFRGTVAVDSLDIPDAVTADSFHVDNVGNMWIGATTFAAAPGKISKAGVATFSNITITGGSIGVSAVVNAPIVKSFVAEETITINDAVYIKGNINSLDLEADTTDYAYITDASQTGLDLSGDFTIECWVKLESAPAGDKQMPIFSKWNNSGNSKAYRAFYHNNNPTMQLLFDVCTDGSTMVRTTINQTLTVGTWYHLAFVHDAGTGTEIFVNGSSIGTGTAVASIYNSSANFQIGWGTNFDAAAVYYDGLIDEIRVWNIVRTSTEINNNKSLQFIGNESGLVGYWRLNNNYNDGTSNGNNLSTSGSPVFSTTVPFSGGGTTIGRADASLATTADNFIGFAKSNITTNSSGDIIISGIATGFSGLTSSSQYYLSDTSGQISTSVGTVTRKVGISISPTEILITNIW